MAVYVPKFTASKLPSSTSFYNLASDSSARKFVSVDAIKNNNPTDSTSNTEHIVNVASGVKTLAAAVQTIAAEARLDVSSAVTSILNSDGQVDPPRKQAFQFTEDDVNTMQRRLGKSASSRYNSQISSELMSKMSTNTQAFITNSRFSFIPNRPSNASTQVVNDAVPQVENILVDLDPRKGATDAFYVGITFNLQMSQLKNVKLVRVFRADMDEPVFTRQLASLSSIGVQKITSNSGRKNADSVNMNVTRLEETGVSNAISKLGAQNPFTGLVNSASPNGSLIVPPPLPGQRVLPNDDPNVPEAFHHLDRSVIENINVLFNLQSNPVFGYSVSPVTSSISVGNNVSGDLTLGRAQRRDQNWNSSNGIVVVDRDNKLMFREISSFSPDACYSQQIGDMVEYYFADDSVTFGGGYKYFIVTVSNQMAQSARSTVVDAVVEAMRIPPRPTAVTVTSDQKSISLAMAVEDQLVEKFEIHRMDTSPNRKTTIIAEVICGQAGFAVEPVLRSLAQNNFMLVGESLNGQKSGATFIDKQVSPGHAYIYRVYSVDVFGNKSESPFEVSAYISDMQDQFVPLKAPSILAEVDSKTKKMKITFSSNEALVQRMRLERRDLTTGEVEFSAPGNPSRVIMGYGRSPLKNRTSLQGELLAGRDPMETWTGFFANTGKQQVFIDQSVQFDHVYQYRIFGEDRYGNRSSYGLSVPLLVNRRPFINAPVNLSSVLIWDSNYKILGVQLAWQPGSQDISAADLLGNQKSLAESSVRTLYQVQRRATGQEVWENFPLTQNTSMLDSVEGVLGDVAPNFRPSFPMQNKMYHYRVQAVQLGNYISNFTDTVSAFVGFSVSDPEFFTLRTPSAYLRPFYVMLNWDTPTASGVVDRWDIERAAINNFAAAKLNLGNPESFASLDYKPFRSVYRESSRFSGRETDAPAGDVNGTVITGEHYYMDTQVDFGNSYYYRIRAVDLNGTTSNWVYRGVKITSQAFERKWSPLFSDEEKKTLALSLQPSVVRFSRKNVQSSMGLLPSFSSPDSVRTLPRISYDIFGNSSQ